MLKPDTIVVVEHSKAHDFSALPHFWQHRAYGSVNFSSSASTCDIARYQISHFIGA